MPKIETQCYETNEGDFCVAVVVRGIDTESLALQISKALDGMIKNIVHGVGETKQ